MININLSQELKDYLSNLNLFIVFNDELIKKTAKTLFYLMHQISKYKKERIVLRNIKLCIKKLTTFYVIRNENISFNNDIKSTEINKKQRFIKYCISKFTDQKSKYMIISFNTNKILNPNLLLENITEFNDKIETNLSRNNILRSNFLNYYFNFIKTKQKENSLESIEIFLEIYLNRIIKRFLANKYISINKLNIYH